MRGKIPNPAVQLLTFDSRKQRLVRDLRAVSCTGQNLPLQTKLPWRLDTVGAPWCLHATILYGDSKIAVTLDIPEDLTTGTVTVGLSPPRLIIV